MAYLALAPGRLVAAPPRVLVDGYELEQVAAAPDIVTPVAMAVDRDGSLLVIESHTHQRPDGYGGPTSDRVRRLRDTDGDDELDAWSTYADGFRHAMNVQVRDDGAVLVVTRGEITLLGDNDGDGRADERQTLVRLETKVDYPHNALSGFAFDPAGGFFLGLGENFGGSYRLVGSDDSEHQDSGGSGMVFHLDDDGSNLRRVAHGFWNPFGLCLLGEQTLLAVDNDPDASPPCRLIHVAARGDYGFRWEYGRAGVHPLQAWDGELPGTLPMVCGTGEAPCTVLPWGEWVWVTSWGDHRLERYTLTRRGMSLDGEREVVVQGDADFRPTGCVVGNDGSLYFCDWVSRSYPVHGKGAIWRLKPSAPQAEGEFEVVQELERERSGDVDALEYASSDDVYARQLAVASMDVEVATAEISFSDAGRLAGLMAMRWIDPQHPKASEWLSLALQDEDEAIQLFALRWICDLHLTEFRDQVAELLEGEMPSERFYLCVLAAIHWLDSDREPPPRTVVDGLLARELRNSRRSAERKALALRLISPTHKQLTLDVLNSYIEQPNRELLTEAVRTLAASEHEDRFFYLARVAGDETVADEVRADALAGLAADAKNFQPLLARLSTSDLPAVAKEATRVRRLAGLAEQVGSVKPPASDLDTWLALVEGTGDADSGRRLFHSPLGPRCGTCHTMNGRGGNYGPDLTRFHTSHDLRQTLTAALDPNRDIAPRYVPWVLETDDGKTHVGMRLPLGGDQGVEPYVDSEGHTFELASESVEYREPSKNSIMPEGLEKTMTVEDMADLLAFLLAGD